MPIQYTSAGPVPGARSLTRALWSGFRLRCPACSAGRLFRAYIEIGDRCPQCATELHHHRADDAPPYFVMMIVGHIIVPLALTLEMAYEPPIWLQFAVWLPLALLLSLVLLPRVKGAIVGLQWALRMHGFGTSAVAERLATYSEHSAASV
jgi:uncharacterized protein (DUF983 family)